MSERTKRACKDLASLVENWDSYGAKSFDKELCDVLEIHLEEIEDVGFFEWALEPGSDGKTVHLELTKK